MTTEELAQFNVVAAFVDRQEAFDVLDAVEDAGVPRDTLSLVSATDDEKFEPGGRDVDDVEGAGKRIVAGAGAGGAVGGVVGALAGAAVIGLPGIGVAVGAGVIFAAAAGGVMAAQTTADEESWKQRVGPLLGMVGSGHVLVGVHTDDEDQADAAARVIEQHDPERLERIVTAEGRPDGI